MFKYGVQTYLRLKDQQHDRSSDFSNEHNQNNDEELRREIDRQIQ